MKNWQCMLMLISILYVLELNLRLKWVGKFMELPCGFLEMVAHHNSGAVCVVIVGGY